MKANMPNFIRSSFLALCLFWLFPLVTSQDDTTTGTTGTTTTTPTTTNDDGFDWGWLGLLGLLGLAGLRRQRPTVSTYQDDTNRATR